MRIVPIAVFLVGAAITRPAMAQCPANTSSCLTCHETQGARPVLHPALGAASPWHGDHAFGDLCASCHAGDREAMDAVVAHTGLRATPLSDLDAACGGCHDDVRSRAEPYRAFLAAAAVPSAPPASTPLPGARPTTTRSPANLVLAAMAVVLAGVLYRLRGALLAPSRARRRTLRAWLTARTWSPYVAGAGLGVIVAVSEALCGRPVIASGAFDKLAAYLGEALFPTSQYYRYVMSPGITWPVWLMVGVLGGAFLSSRLAGDARWRWLPDTQWEPRFGSSRTLRLALAFAGAALVQIGAGIAGGCTSGLAISGGAVLAPAAFVFMAGMFAGGIPTAWLWYRGRRTA